MRETSVEGLYVGRETDCCAGTTSRVVVHACKHPCHQVAVGYRGNLPRDHPHYLVLERGYDLYLNMIDPDGPLFMPPLFLSFLAFGSRHWEAGREILIHCNQGESRAPSLALLFLAKHLHLIPDESYEAARSHFIEQYPWYAPGRGIRMYLGDNWHEF